MAEGPRGSGARGRSSGRRIPRTPEEKFPKGYFDAELAIDFIQLEIYNIAQIMRRVELLSKSVPGFAFIGLRLVHCLSDEFRDC